VGLLLAAPYSLLTMHACHFTSIKILLLLLLTSIAIFSVVSSLLSKSQTKSPSALLL
jgi:hypothetical protein